MKYAFASFLALVISFSSLSQKGKEYLLVDSVNYEKLSIGDKAVIDSLLPLYHKANYDTSKLRILDALTSDLNDEKIWIRYNKLLYEKANILLKNSGSMSVQETRTVKKYFANSLQNTGYYNYNYEANSAKAMQLYNECIAIQQEIDDEEGISGTLNNMAIVYQVQGNISKALDLYFQSLKIHDVLHDKKGIAGEYNNIANVYISQKDSAKALHYLQKSIALLEEIGYKYGLAFALGNTGLIYRDRKEYEKALEYFQRSLKVSENIGDRQSMSFAIQNIGFIYQKQAEAMTSSIKKDSLSALSLDYMNRALALSRESNDKQNISRILCDIGNKYLSENNISKAIDYGQQAIILAKEAGFPIIVRNASELLFKAYRKQNKWKDALDMHELFLKMRDSVFNDETQKSTFKQQTKYEYEKQQALKDVQHQKELAIADEEKKRQKIITYSIGLGLLMVVLFSIFIFNRLRITRKQKQIIEYQKKIVDQKNKHITDSINYAKRIQDSILPSPEELAKHFSDYFIFFRPREIVSGDFYWLSSQKEKTILAVADCTGHGVPGAFMSMIGNTLLNEIVNEKNIFQPAEILNHLNEGIVHALHQESRTQDDGMDVSVCLFDKGKNKITFAGANHSMYIVHNNSINEIKGDIYSIGSMFSPKNSAQSKTNVQFTQKEISLVENFTLFFTTDGFADQIGGGKGKKFLVKQLLDLLTSVSSLAIKEQEEKITNAFKEWKGNYAQLDDVLLVGIKSM